MEDLRQTIAEFKDYMVKTEKILSRMDKAIYRLSDRNECLDIV